MKIWQGVLIFFLASFSVLSQNNTYWQQEVNYSIEVSLNDKNHSLEGIIEIEYTNNSPDKLDFIYFHLWPNAFKNRQTEFAKQKLESGSTKFHYAYNSERGFIDSLDFKAWDKPCKLVFEANDYAKLILPESLESGKTTLLKTPFYVKIPESFSRLGHVEQSYQITQWYPKPAVYDANGWHAMPYLDQGEFYSEYGCFDVKITLPENYVVGATGDLQTKSEIDFLNQLAEKTVEIDSFATDDNFPPSSNAYKTLHYTQCDVHDFAWFADKRFHVLKGKANLPQSGREVTLWAMFTNVEANLWKNSIEYLHDGTMFYSARVGEYPYNQVTAVQSALSAGAGMEYPNITVIGESGNAENLEDVIVHEVGHNWFYGQLGSNERDYPWMDEGINSYYDQRYKREKYPEKQFNLPAPFKWFVKPNKMPNRNVWELAYQLQARKANDQAIGLHSKKYTDTNYGLMVYLKSAIAFDYLAAYLGQKKFDDVMHKYYQTFEYKHPQPQDIKALFEKETGKDLSWFFEELINTDKKIDYHIWKVDKNAEEIGKSAFHHVMVLNAHKNIASPFNITAVKNSKAIETVWYDGFHGNETVLFPAHDYDELVIDYNHNMVEYNRKNNTIKNNGLLKKIEPLKIRFFPNGERADKTQLYLTPVIGGNAHDKFMVGLSSYNSTIPATNFEYSGAVLYAFGTKQFNWLGQVAYNIYPSSNFLKRVRLNFATSSFSEGDYKIRAKNIDDGNSFDYYTQKYKYYRFAPEISFDFANKNARSKVSKQLKFRHINILKEDVDGSQYIQEIKNDTTLTFNSTSPANYNNNFEYYVNELSFEFKNNRRLLPFGLGVMLEQHPNFIKTKLEGAIKITYPKTRKGIIVKAFFSAFLWENLYNENEPLTQRKNPFYKNSLNTTVLNDYKYDNLFLGRNLTEGFLSQQIINDNAGFYSNPYGIDNGVGFSDKWLAALNIEIEDPLKLPFITFSVYGNLAINNRSVNKQAYSGNINTIPNYEQVLLSEFGISTKLFNNALGIHLPIIVSKDLKNASDNFAAGKYFKRITFTLNLNKLNPIKTIRNIEL